MNKIEEEKHIEKLLNSAERLIEKKQKQSPETGQVDAIVMRIREKCEEEIKWVKGSLDEHAKLSNYTEADEHYLPGYRKAFEEILEMLKDA